MRDFRCKGDDDKLQEEWAQAVLTGSPCLGRMGGRSALKLNQYFPHVWQYVHQCWADAYIEYSI